MLPSPLTFPTPVVQVGAPQGWGRPSQNTTTMPEPGLGEKRKGGAVPGIWSDERGGAGEGGGEAKKVKT